MKREKRPSIEALCELTEKLPRKVPYRVPHTYIGPDSVNHWPDHKPDHPRYFHCWEKNLSWVWKVQKRFVFDTEEELFGMICTY